MELLTTPAVSPVLHGLSRGALGGVLIGVAAGLLMLANGRLAGLSGLFAGLLGGRSATWKEDLLFLAGLPLGALAFRFRLGGDIGGR